MLEHPVIQTNKIHLPYQAQPVYLPSTEDYAYIQRTLVTSSNFYFLTDCKLQQEGMAYDASHKLLWITNPVVCGGALSDPQVFLAKLSDH